MFCVQCFFSNTINKTIATHPMLLIITLKISKITDFPFSSFKQQYALDLYRSIPNQLRTAIIISDKTKQNKKKNIYVTAHIFLELNKSEWVDYQ